MRILEVFVTFGDIFGSELSKIGSKTLDHAFKDHFLREIMIHNEFSNLTVYDIPIFEDGVCFTMCVFVNFGHFGPFSGSKKTKIGLCTPKYSFSGHVSVEVIVQREISDPTVYDIPIFGDCVCFTVCDFVNFGRFGPFRGQNDQNRLRYAKIFIFRPRFY